MSNKISVLIDVTVDKANQALGSFRKSINDADGAVGKLKAGSSAAFGAIKANAAELALAGGAAVVAFSAKSIAKFQDTAIEAGKLSDALGIPVEEMSRLVEVAGDLGVESSALEAVLGKMNQTAGKSPAAFEAIGAEIVKTDSGVTDVNATFKATIDALNDIVDPTKRAAAAQQIFGRSWRDSAELIGLGGERLAEAMANVSDAKVIDDDEVRKAREFRERLDELSDAVEDIQLAVGEYLVPTLTDMADAFLTVKDAASSLGDILPDMPGWLEGVADKAEILINPIGELSEQIGELDDAINPEAMGTLGKSITEYTPAVEDATDATEEVTTQTDAWAEALQDASDKWDYLTGQLDTNDAIRNTAEQFDAVADAALLAWDAAVNNADDAEEKQRNYRQSVDDTKREVFNLVDQLGKVPTEVATQITALIDEGKFAEAERRLAMLTTARNVYVRAVARGGAIQSSQPNVFGATGGIVNRPTVATIGEAGPEAVVPLNRTPGNGPLPADLFGGGSTVINLTVNSLDARSAGKQIKQALDEYYKNGGAR